jgi:hypothetical protein
MNHGDFTYTFRDNVGNDDTDSAYDTTLGSMLDNYQSTLVGFFDDETTGISDVSGKMENTRGKVYDLQGRKVNGQCSMVNGQLNKGLYIVNGRKFFNFIY